MRLKKLELSGFKSFARSTVFLFESPVTAIVGPNGSGKSNCAEAVRWVLGERSMKSLRVHRGGGEDLIWNGGGARGPAKLNRAAVSLTFDNRDRRFALDFDEVTIGREVYRDGDNNYLINGSAVRHRDVIELLAGVSLGAAGHAIIHQGEADRMLSASPALRRAFLEDALGLRLYQWRIEESEKKLAKTEENMNRAEALRQEIAPHLRFLKKQVEKITKADEFRRELKRLYLDYLRREAWYLEQEAERLAATEAGPQQELVALEKRLASLDKTKGAKDDRADSSALTTLDERRRQIAVRKDELARRLGRLEGLIEAREGNQAVGSKTAERDFTYREVANLIRQVDQDLAVAEQATELSVIRSFLARLREIIKRFLTREPVTPPSAVPDDLEHWRGERAHLVKALAKETAAEEAVRAQREALEGRVRAELVEARAAEREVFELRARRSELLVELSIGRAAVEKLAVEKENFQRELAEGRVLLDQEVSRYGEAPLPADTAGEARGVQEERRRRLERLKIRLEDLGVDSGDTLKEHQAAAERDAFLAKELEDLKQGAVSLRQLIRDLRSKIAEEFDEGLAKINRQFQELFSLLFNGGAAKLSLVELETSNENGEENVADSTGNDGGPKPRRGVDSGLDGGVNEAGIEISVNLPRKRIHGLEMLSGGERALTSIALLFAMSQVNPPPFLILDETDAALDEANSRKYGEMMANLARRSQLILITHNRETMSRAGVLYGVTMGGDGVSRLLSIKFDEAAVYAK